MRQPRCGPRRAAGMHLALVALGLVSLTAPLGAQEQAPPGDLVSRKVPSWQVRGYGQDLKDAEENALLRAHEVVASYLREHYPDLGWTPSPAFLRRSGMVQTLGPPVNVPLERSGVVLEVRMEVILDPSHIEQIQQMARRHRIQDRHQLAALLLVACCIFLGVLSIYLKLEDVTRGYYTSLLRLAALSVVGLACAGLWWYSG